MTSPGSLTALEEAQAALLAMLAPVAPQVVAADEALGLIAAGTAPLGAPVPVRAFALRPGFALRAEELAGASAYAPALLARAPVLVAAGDDLPEGCDCVIDEAAVDVSGPLAQAHVESWPGENIRRAGEDFATGAVVLAHGIKIGARDLLAASCAGIAEIAVRRPGVAIVGARGASADLLARLARGAGARVVDVDAADLVLAVGDATAEWSLRGIALEPGRDAALGQIGGAPALLIPPTPDQAFAVYWALARPALDRLAARAPRERRTMPLAGKIASRVGVAEIAVLSERDGRFLPLAAGDLPLQLLTRATHAAILPAGSEGHAAGEPFAAEPLIE